MKKYERIIALLVLIQFIPFSVYAQIGSSSTMKKIDTIENNTATDITLRPGENVVIDSTSHLQVPIGSTAQRDPAPVNGVLRYNSDNNEFEGFVNGLWGKIAGGTDLTTKGNLVGYDGAETKECVLTATNDYILTYDSTADCGFDFKAAPVSTTLTTKGDIQTYDTANARLPVGNDGQFLTADSAESVGLKWIDFPDVSGESEFGNLFWNDAVRDGGTFITSVNPNEVEKTGGGLDWNVNLRSIEEVLGGKTRITFKIQGISSAGYTIGFQEAAASCAPATDCFQDITYGFFLSNNSLYYLESGSFSVISTVVVNDIIEVNYDGVQVTYKKNGTIIRTVSSPTFNYPVGVGITLREVATPPVTDIKLYQAPQSLPVLTNKGDIYIYDGNSITKRTASNDGDIIYYDSTTTDGLNTKPYSPLTTKGDLYIFDTDNNRLPVGAQGAFLMVDDTKPEGIQWYDGVTVKDYDDTPVGTVIAYGSTNVPSGYLLADGSCYKKLDYEQLFNVIGTSAGECTVTTTNDGFNVPNLQDQFLRGITGGRSVFDSQADATAANGLSGSASGGTHTHAIQGGINLGGNSSGTSVVSSYANNPAPFSQSPLITGAIASNTGSHTHSVSISGDSETRPANIAVVYMIKAEGREPIFGIEKKGLAPNKAGFIIWSAFSATPEGHRLANGDCVLKTDYDDLFTNIGTTFGECTISTTNDGFNLPDLVTENRFIRSAGGSIAHGTTQTDTTAVNGLSASGGAHTHNLLMATDSFPTGTGSNWYPPQSDDTSPQNRESSIAINSTGSTHSHTLSGDTETRPNNIALTPFIKMYNNDVITGVFEQIEEVIVEQDTSNVNDFSANISNVGNVNSENFDWINGNCSNSATGEITCTFNGGIFTQTPSCSVTPKRNVENIRYAQTAYIGNESSTQVIFRHSIVDDQQPWGTSAVGTDNSTSFSLKCSKQGADVNKSIKGAVVQASSLGVKCQTKLLSSNVNSDTPDIASLRFDNLIVGRSYKISGQAYMDSGSGTINNRIILQSFTGATKLHQTRFRTPNQNSELTTGIGSSCFEAEATALVSATTATNGTAQLVGNSTRDATWLELCELPENYNCNYTGF